MGQLEPPGARASPASPASRTINAARLTSPPGHTKHNKDNPLATRKDSLMQCYIPPPPPRTWRSCLATGARIGVSALILGLEIAVLFLLGYAIHAAIQQVL